ncbi:hypothetical protein A3J90_06660 [candidate division WOR-1 bacterium RIFOXYC2_FULL_37_10]|uniref:HTH arsR-type domain-containing protein n=1 Tax=candidate division WOR-1 bacterium RIFOXYB2_FULL_37_13 TaxID=1802579 RepID=A0A1F4SQ35_UNCSA|nr:MAG: hypothetical protein A2310_07295 [candidate division WOR-1 bacterium RIFOXYB2_FULL_37_13]OGC33379.1 MAG: hypothetical protein A3J90_06660 [candidate division WOR-1 bacterium RIFOXYC2_FULL_37_10]
MDKDIKKLIKKGESELVEFKKSFDNEAIETISAFSNTVGGKILVGVSDSGNIIGISIGKGTLERLANKIQQETDPKVYPSITMKKIDGKTIIVIQVMPSPDKSVLAFGRPYKRVGKSSFKMSKDEYEFLILEKHKDKLQFDKQSCKGATLKDVDVAQVKNFLKKIVFERRLYLDLKISAKDVLKRLDLIVNNKLTNAAMLLFGKNTQKFFSQAKLKCARFKGISPIEFIDMKVFGGNLFQQRDDALEFIKEHIKLHAEIKGTERIEKWEYPIEAIREAITNAICHRDYGIASNIQIRVFDDRMEIWGCGHLPNPLIPEDLKKKHKSILRNPLIGKCFFLMKYIEEWGTGTNRMVKTCLKEGLPEPIFEETSGDFLVTFRKYRISEESFKELNERQKKIVDYLRENKKINRRTCMGLLNTSKDTAVRELVSLQEKSLIMRNGKGKNVYYYLA